MKCKKRSWTLYDLFIIESIPSDMLWSRCIMCIRKNNSTTEMTDQPISGLIFPLHHFSSVPAHSSLCLSRQTTVIVEGHDLSEHILKVRSCPLLYSQWQKHADASLRLVWPSFSLWCWRGVGGWAVGLLNPQRSVSSEQSPLALLR